MQNSDEENSNGYLSEEETERYFRLLEELPEFARLFDYGEPSDRAVAIVGPAFLDRLLKEALVNFLIDDEKEVVEPLLGKNGPLGTLGSRITACYCLGFIGEIVKSDLRLVGKIRNEFAHDLHADFSDTRMSSWCRALRWHKEFFSPPPCNATDRDLFQVGVNQLVSHLHGVVSIARGAKRTKVLYR